jgi:chromosome segregation ATPase
MSDTPRTDKEIVGELLVFASFARKLERELAAVTEERDRLDRNLDEARQETTRVRQYMDHGFKVAAEEATELREQRDRALTKIENQAERIKYLEGATNHATGTPLSKMREQRDRLAAIARELTAMIRVNVMWGRFAECSVEQIDEHLKPWNEKIAAVKGGSDDN